METKSHLCTRHEYLGSRVPFFFHDADNTELPVLSLNVKNSKILTRGYTLPHVLGRVTSSSKFSTVNVLNPSKGSARERYRGVTCTSFVLTVLAARTICSK